jgi:ABC-2 type transport system ATP-binding protein
LPLPEESLAVRKQLGLVPDDTLLFDYLTGLEYLEFVARLYEMDKGTANDRAKELLDLFELVEAPRKLIGEYSKGMRKRLAMAAALIHRPKLFLMDEPFEGVDAVGARLMKDILLEQVRHGATIFLTSHVLEVVERLCTEIAIINRGKVVVHGTVAELQRAGAAHASSLEEIFVEAVGGERANQPLGWL